MENKTNYLKMHDRVTPRCTTKDKYKTWRDMVPSASKYVGFCEDCTPEFQKQKCSQGMCDHPEVLFYKDKNGLIYGSYNISDEVLALTA